MSLSRYSILILSCPIVSMGVGRRIARFLAKEAEKELRAILRK